MLIQSVELSAARELVAKQFRLRAEGQLDPASIEAATQRISTFSRAYDASTSLFGPVLQVIKTHGRGGTFNGTVVPPVGLAGGWGGRIFTDDEERLIDTTVTFEINIAVVYCSVLFFDSSSQLLGHFQGGGLGFAALIGGGEGNWS